MHAAATLIAIALATSEGWTEPARAFLEAHRSYFFQGGNTTAGMKRTMAAQARAARATAPRVELREALAGPDPRLRALAVARLAAAEDEKVDPELATLVLHRFAQEDDPNVRWLSLYVMRSAGREWARSHGGDLAGALAHERNPGVATVAATDVLPLLGTDDLVVAAAALASNGDKANRKVVFATIYFHAHGAGLRVVADLLRRNGRTDLAAEAEKHLADSEHVGK